MTGMTGVTGTTGTTGIDGMTGMTGMTGRRGSPRGREAGRATARRTTAGGAPPVLHEGQRGDKHTGKPAQLTLGRPFRQQGIGGRERQQAKQ